MYVHIKYMLILKSSHKLITALQCFTSCLVLLIKILNVNVRPEFVFVKVMKHRNVARARNI